MHKIHDNLKWISSLGGPLILMDQSTLANWYGDRAQEIWSSDSISDYDRAGAVEDYVETLTVREGITALVLGDLPSHTTHVPVDAETCLLVRWVWAENEEQVRTTLQKFNIKLPWNDTGIKISFDSGSLVLFDSVYAGNEIVDSLNFNIEAGNYTVATYSHQPIDQVNLFLILITKAGHETLNK